MNTEWFGDWPFYLPTSTPAAIPVAAAWHRRRPGPETRNPAAVPPADRDGAPVVPRRAGLHP